MCEPLARGMLLAMSVAPGDHSGPFYDVIRRRHPDVDIVLLPPEQPSPAASGTPGQSAEAVVAEDDALGPAEALAQLHARVWDRADLGEPSEERTARWVPADEVALRREVLAASAGVDAVRAVTALAAVEQLLVSDGWQVLAPATGMPRVLASRQDDGRTWELAMSYAAAAGGRLALRISLEPVRVTEQTRGRLLAGES